MWKCLLLHLLFILSKAHHHLSPPIMLTPYPHLLMSTPCPHLLMSTPCPHLLMLTPCPHLLMSTPCPHLLMLTPCPHLLMLTHWPNLLCLLFIFFFSIKPPPLGPSRPSAPFPFTDPCPFLSFS